VLEDTLPALQEKKAEMSETLQQMQRDTADFKLILKQLRQPVQPGSLDL
jgi:hypothetical protein